jgi:hypothetical protein
MPDVTIQNEGTISLFHLNTNAAREWVSANVYSEDRQIFGDALAVEHRFADDVLIGMLDSDLEVE